MGMGQQLCVGEEQRHLRAGGLLLFAGCDLLRSCIHAVQASARLLDSAPRKALNPVGAFVLLCSVVTQGLGECAQEYEQFYVPELQAKQRAKEEQEKARQAKEMAKLRQDMANKAAISTGSGAGAAAAAAAAGGEDEEEEGESADLELSDDSIEGSVGAASE